MKIKDNQKFKVLKAFKTMLLIETNNKTLEIQRQDSQNIKEGTKGHFEIFYKDKVILRFEGLNIPLEVV